MAIEAGADTTLTNRYGETALIPAADRGHVKVVEYLLSESDVDVDHMNNLHWTALLEAVILGDGVTALEHAEQRGYLEIIELFKGQ